MKEIKKSHWTYKLVEYTFDQCRHKNICSFYFDVFLAMLMAPMCGYIYGIAKLFNLIEPEDKQTRLQDKWSWPGIQAIALFCLWMVSFIFCSIVGLCFGVDPTKNTSSLFLWAIPCLLIYPFIIYAIILGIQELKTKYCKPIIFINDNESN